MGEATRIQHASQYWNWCMALCVAKDEINTVLKLWHFGFCAVCMQINQWLLKLVWSGSLGDATCSTHAKKSHSCQSCNVGGCMGGANCSMHTKPSSLSIWQCQVALWLQDGYSVVDAERPTTTNAMWHHGQCRQYIWKATLIPSWTLWGITVLNNCYVQ